MAKTAKVYYNVVMDKKRTRTREIFRGMKIFLAILVFVGAIGFMLWDVNRSENGGNQAGSANELVIGTDPGFKPFEYKEGSTTVGFDIDLARNIALEQNKTLRVEEMVFDGLLLALQSGRIDLAIAGMTKTAERAQNVDFSIPYYNAAQMIIVQKGSTIRGEADLVGRKIGVQLGTTGDDLAHKIREAKVVQLPQTANVMQELNAGRIDAAIMDNGPATQYLANNPKLKMLENELSVEEYAIAVKKGNAELLQQVNRSIKNMKKDGRYAMLVKKYFGEKK